MLDLKRATRLSGWVSERDACEDWFNSTHDAITIDHLHDPERDMYLACKNIPEPGTYVSQYGEFGDDERFSLVVESVDFDDEVIVAVPEDDIEGERIEIGLDELCCLDGTPMWSTLWALNGEPDYSEIAMYNECGISVYRTESDDFFIGINGCGYDFYEAHWLPLYRKMGICWHTTEERWMAELKSRVSSYVEASTGIPSEMSWSERSELLSKISGDLLNSKRIARKARLALLRHNISCYFKKLRAAFTIDPNPYRPKRKRLA